GPCSSCFGRQASSVSIDPEAATASRSLSEGLSPRRSAASTRSFTSPSSASTTALPPFWSLPKRSSSVSGCLTVWSSTRARGRAPKAGSKPFSARSVRPESEAGVETVAELGGEQALDRAVPGVLAAYGGPRARLAGKAERAAGHLPRADVARHQEDHV